MTTAQIKILTWTLSLILMALCSTTVSSAEERGGNYLMLIAEEFDSSAPLTEFINFKTSLGFIVKKYTVTASMSNTDIRDYILSLWPTVDAPDYILIVGDTPAVPHWSGGGSKSAPTDLPYACMDPGDDWYP
ncbi:MAG: C25 family cysteine peptidase, partial [Planctomycetota bacterium]